MDQSLTATQRVIANALQGWLSRTYRFNASEQQVAAAARTLERVVNQHEMQVAVEPSNAPFIVRAFYKWYSTTNMPKTDKHRHSAAGFVNFLSKRYWIIAIPRLWKKRSLKS